MQGYGQTEAGPVISANPPDAIRIDTVGTPLTGGRSADRRGRRDPGARRPGHGRLLEPPAGNRARSIHDGWLHTGDIGELDRGYLRITDRKRDMIVLSGGENVSPAKIEGMLMAETEIAQAVVDRRGPQRPERAGGSGRGLRRRRRGAGGQPDQHRLSVTERIRRHALVPPFTIENGLLTPSQKIRRVLVHARERHMWPVALIGSRDDMQGSVASLESMMQHDAGNTRVHKPLRWRGRSARRRGSRFCPIVDFCHASRGSRGTRR